MDKDNEVDTLLPVDSKTLEDEINSYVSDLNDIPIFRSPTIT